MSERATRIDLLSRRVQWLDKHHRRLAMAAAAIVAPLLVWSVSNPIADSPTAMLTFMLGVVIWWVVEIALAGVTATWETECAQIHRDRGLPRATVVRK